MWGDGSESDMTGRLVAGWGAWMGWVLRLVETGIDGPARVIDVMDLKPLGGLGNIAKLGLTLPEAKLLLGHVQQVVVAAQADDHAVLRPDCSSCDGACRIKDWRVHRVATLFDIVAVRLPRFRCAGCGHGETGVSWPSYCRSTPEFDELRAHVSALMPYRVAAELLSQLLPVDAGNRPETLRGHTLKVGTDLRDTAVKPAAVASTITGQFGLDVHPEPSRRRAASGGSRRQRRDLRWRPAGIRRRGEGRDGYRGADPAQP